VGGLVGMAIAFERIEGMRGLQAALEEVELGHFLNMLNPN